MWTDGIGNTSGVVPGKTITERQAAQGLITNVLRVERALDKCVVQPMPQKVYDAVVSFAFNVGTGGNACSSTLVVAEPAALGGCLPSAATLGICQRCV